MKLTIITINRNNAVAGLSQFVKIADCFIKI